AEIRIEHTIVGAKQVLQKVFVPFAARAEQVGAPDEEVARPVRRMVWILAGKGQLAVSQLLYDEGGRVLARSPRCTCHLQRIAIELWRRWEQPILARRSARPTFGARMVADRSTNRRN